MLTLAKVYAFKISTIVTAVHIGENTVFGAAKVLGLASGACESRFAVTIGECGNSRGAFDTCALV